jgi:hypothetical protein
VYFINIPIHNGQNIIGIEYEFGPEYHNPAIKIHWMGKELPEKYIFRNASNDEDKSKDFFDGKYHLFTFIKFADDTFKLILDDLTSVSAPLISGKIDGNTITNVNNKNSYKISFNSAVDDPTPADDSDIGTAPNVPLNCYLNAIGIYNRSLETHEIHKILEHFSNAKYYLDPRFMKAKDELENLKDVKKCPFTDKDVCSTRNCAQISNWLDNSEILANTNCYKDVSRYCNTGMSQDTMCTFYNVDNVNKSAAHQATSTDVTVMKNSTLQERETEISKEENILQQLEKLGIKNISLDKALRTKGQYSDEINSIIDKISEQIELEDNGLQSLTEVPDFKDDLNEITHDKLKTDGGVTKPFEIIDLKYNDLESFDEIIKEYESEKK